VKKRADVTGRRPVEFFYSIGSRYSYLSATQLGRLTAETECVVEWLPINSVRLLAERGYSPFEHADTLRGQYEPAYRERDARRWSELYNVPFKEPRGRIELEPELWALAATAGKRLGRGAELSLALFDALFGGAVERLDAAECVRRAEGIGLAKSRFEHELRAPETRAALEQTMRRAHQSGVFGVPTFALGDEQYWGNDRLPLLRHALAKLAG
jgi:2-hydroxychromene-2-carboxylate isomerase